MGASSNRWLLVAGVVLAGLVGLSVLVGVLGEDEQEFDEGTPEATVQRYVRALADEDAAVITSLLSADLQQRCDLVNIRNYLSRPDDNDLRVVLRETDVRDGTAMVRVSVTERYDSGPFDGGGYTHDETFDLERVNGDWLFSSPPWPIFCPVPAPKPLS